MALEDCIFREVNIVNQWYDNNSMIVNETKHQGMVLEKHYIDIIGMNIDDKLSYDNYIYCVR